MEKFTIGLVIGCVGGALITANSYKMRMLVRKTQEEVQAKLDQMMDEKIKAMEAMTEEMKEETAMKIQTVKPKTVRKTAKTEKTEKQS
ncbi:MAG: hypothetical protein IKA20_06200 [Clostridia bacterium]|nr:hypothetical protein [Clostridia bacterium]